MGKGSFKKLIISLLLLAIGVSLVLLLVGSPFSEETSLFSEAELSLAGELGTEISKRMGQVTISPESCEQVLSELPFYIDRVAPLTEKLFSVDAVTLERTDSSKISNVSDGIQWIYSKCKGPTA